MRPHAITNARAADPLAGKPADNSVASRPLTTDICSVTNGGDSLLHAAKLTVTQAARKMGLGETKMRQIIRNGGVPVVRIMGKTMLLERDLEDYLRSGYGLLRKDSTPSTRIPALPDAVRDSKYLR